MARYDVLTRFAKLAVLTTPPIETFATLEIYPAVPRPITVEAS